MSGTAGDLGNTFLEYDYSLGAKCATEAIGMGFIMYLGLSIIANELLPRTKVCVVRCATLATEMQPGRSADLSPACLCT